MKVELDYKWGDSIFILNDSEQVEYRLNRIILEPKGRVTLELLNPDGELMEVYELHTSKEKNILKTLEGNGEDEN